MIRTRFDLNIGIAVNLAGLGSCRGPPVALEWVYDPRLPAGSALGFVAHFLYHHWVVYAVC